MVKNGDFFRFFATLVTGRLLLTFRLDENLACEEFFAKSNKNSQNSKFIDDCLQELKLAAADSSLYWFGQKWKFGCSRKSQVDEVACYNPEKLRPYQSVGSRLLRVHTFDLAYLHNLKFIPRIVFTSEKGQYEGCDHLFKIHENHVTSLFWQSDPVPPFHLRSEPKIHVPATASEYNFFTVLMLDVGSGRAHYLAYNFPHETTVVQAYVGPLNFRHSIDPFAVLIFEQNKRLHKLHWKNATEKDGTFNVNKLIMANDFHENLVGLNWINVGFDAYSIEKERTEKSINHCPYLLKEKIFYLQKSTDSYLFWSWISHNLPYHQKIEKWLTVTYKTRASIFDLCCQEYQYRTIERKLDPLGDLKVDFDDIQSPPSIRVSKRIRPFSNRLPRRMEEQPRAQSFVYNEPMYTMLLLDLNGAKYMKNKSSGNNQYSYVIWLVVHIPQNLLIDSNRTNSIDSIGQPILRYMTPKIIDRNSDSFLPYVFLLFRETDHHTTDFLPLRTVEHCPAGFIGRCSLDVLEFSARNSLDLVGISWMYVKLSGTHGKNVKIFKNPKLSIEENSLGGKYRKMRNTACKNSKKIPTCSFDRFADGNLKTYKSLSMTNSACATACYANFFIACCFVLLNPFFNVLNV